MKLSDLLAYNKITVQCHDIPDADAIGSGFGLYTYFLSQGKDVRFIYSGRAKITKSNLILMITELEIPIEYVECDKENPHHFEGLLVTTDCQYSAGNVSRFTADDYAIIDHHQPEIEDIKKSIIMPMLGSCSTLVWNLMRKENFDFEAYPRVGTALYLGLYTDTGSLSEIRNPLDMDLRDQIKYDQTLLTLFKNCNISLDELDITGIAMSRYVYNDEHGFAVIKSDPCDPNILGVISDFLLQVDVIKACVVFNPTGDGYKISVRSCVKEVNASELASYLTEGIGSGGGHFQKAGGYASASLLKKKFGDIEAETYFNNRMAEYFRCYNVIDSDTYEVDLSRMKTYKKKNLPIGYVNATDVFPVGTPITIRTLEGDIDLDVSEDIVILIGIKGEVYPNKREKFNQSYKATDEKYVFEDCVVSPDYVPTIKKRGSIKAKKITEFAHVCIPTGETYIYAREIVDGIKVFTAWDKERYWLGRPGDYLACRSTDLHDIYIVERDIFDKSYERAEI